MSVTKDGTITAFGYDNTHPDRLTSYNGKAITYNANGGVASYDGYTYTWNKGKLSSISKVLESSPRALIPPSLLSSKTYSFDYNGFGQRISSSYNYINVGDSPLQFGELTAYNKKFSYDHNGRLIRETNSRTFYQDGSDSYEILYLYDDSSIVGMVYTKNNTTSTYYFQRNLLGDIIGIYDTNGNKVAGYTYDAWGNCSITSDTTNQTVAYVNSFRYRGYYYDSETGLYYLNARYYSPEWRRFISPDDTSYLDPENVNGLNLYCYCGNDPVNYADPSGHEAEWYNILGWIGVGLVVTAATILTMGAFGIAVGGVGLLGAAIHGAAVGTLIGAGVGAVGGAASGIIYDAVAGNDFGTSIWAGVQAGFGIGAIAGAVIGAVWGYNSFVKIDINKFTKYALDPANSGGKSDVFNSLGYTKENAQSLVKIYRKQALKNYIKKNYSLATLDQYGQRITISIRIGDSVLKSGWMIVKHGIRLITPFSGFI